MEDLENTDIIRATVPQIPLNVQLNKDFLFFPL